MRNVRSVGGSRVHIIILNISGRMDALEAVKIAQAVRAGVRSSKQKFNSSWAHDANRHT